MENEPTGILIDAGCTLEEVLELLAQAKAAVMAGAITVTSWRSGDSSVTRIQGIGPERMVAECNWALSVLSPEEHEMDIVRPITRGVFS